MLAQLMKATLRLVFAMGIASVANAQDVAVPEGDVILTISGDIENTNAGDTLIFDRETFADLGTVTFETTTIWTDGVHSFQGVSLEALANLIGAQDGMLLATAINDYTVEIPVSDAVVGGPIVAYLMDGEEMLVRDKGPLWVIYPYDSSADYRSEVVYSRSIWQLDRIEVVK